MKVFAVWAPEHGRVRVRVNDQVHDMEARPGGWWRVALPVSDSPVNYGYLIDEDPILLPDPRSVWQPDGVHSTSRSYDHTVFPWQDATWKGKPLAGGIIYELHIGTFTEAGTFDSAIDKLDHLVRLGIDFVEVMPINAFDGPHGWGYDGVLWFAVHEPYGGPDGFKRFVNACHAKGLAVLLDVVYNHLGPSGAYLNRFGPYFKGETVWGPALNLDDQYSDEVRRYVIDNSLSWLRDFHVDGLRIDAVHALHDQRAINILAELTDEVDALATHLGRPLSLIAESDLNDPRVVTSRDAQGYGLTAQWSDDLHHCLHAMLTGERQGYYTDFGSIPGLAHTLRHVFFHAGTWSTFRKRSHGRPVDITTIRGHRFLAYLQNHDQVGNRAAGDRLSATVSPGLLICGIAIVLCSPYTPMLFMGEEWAASTPWQFFASFPDPHLADQVRSGRKEEFAEHGWDITTIPDPMDITTFIRSKLDWRELEKSHHLRILRAYTELIALRKKYSCLSDPRLDRFVVDYHSDPAWLVLHRGNCRVVCNLSGAEVAIDLGQQIDEVLFSSTEGTVRLAGAVVHLPTQSVAILTLSHHRY